MHGAYSHAQIWEFVFTHPPKDSKNCNTEMDFVHRAKALFIIQQPQDDNRSLCNGLALVIAEELISMGE